MGSALAGSKCCHGDELPRNGPSSASLPSAYAKSSDDDDDLWFVVKAWQTPVVSAKAADQSPPRRLGDGFAEQRRRYTRALLWNVFLSISRSAQGGGVGQLDNLKV